MIPKTEDDPLAQAQEIHSSVWDKIEGLFNDSYKCINNTKIPTRQAVEDTIAILDLITTEVNRLIDELDNICYEMA